MWTGYKVIRLKLFLDIVPSSSEDITRAMRGLPKRLSQITWGKWRELHFICFGFVSYRRCFLHSQPLFLCSRAFRLFFCWFDCSLFCRLFGFREFNQVNFNGNSNEYHGCVSVRYNFLFISLLLFTKVHKITTWNRLIPGSAYLRERELYDGQFSKFL